MTELELRKLKRTEFLEMLLEQTREKEQLMEEVDQLKKRLEDREIRIDKAGSIAQAAFEMNGVLEAAQAAAQQYLDNIKLLSDRQESICEKKEKEVFDRCAAREQTTYERCDLMKEETEKSCAELEQSTKARCEAREQETETRCLEREKECEKRCAAMTSKAEEDVENKWKDLSERLEEFYEAHVGLRDLLTATGGILRD